MRSSIYRNLDVPFRILGFNVAEIMLLCVALVGGGELARSMAIHQAWAFVITFALAITLFCMRRFFDDLFGQRLIRFLRLPRALGPKLLQGKE